MSIHPLAYRHFESEFRFQTSRSSGPGGQNVNKVSSRVELRFNVKDSKILSEDEKEIILLKLANRISQDGILIIAVQLERSQIRNKQLAIDKFYNLISRALMPVKRRIATKPTRSAREKRLQNKRQTSEKKARRSTSNW